jgi:hypothetical protein
MNKIYLTTRTYARHYIEHFAQADLGVPWASLTKFRAYDGPASPIRITEMFGADVLSYSPDRFGVRFFLAKALRQQRRLARQALGDSYAWQYLRQSALGGTLRRLADRYLPY